MAYPGKIDEEALRLLVLSGKTQAEIAKVFGANPRTVRDNIAKARRVHGAGWPHKPPTPRAKPPVEPRAASLAAAEARSVELVPPPPDATPDELEAYALRVYVSEAQACGKDRIAAARALVELADKRRLRRPANADAQTDPAEAAAAVMLEIERATANVEKSTSDASIPVADVPGV